MMKNDEDKKIRENKENKEDKKNKIFSDIKVLIDDAELILVGCGTELSFLELCKKKKYSNTDIFKATTEYGISKEEELKKICRYEEDFKWINNLLTKKYIDSIKSEDNFYNSIFKLIENKKYFVISTNTDNLIYQSKLDNERIVTPYGTDNLFQCSESCSNDIWDTKEYIDNINKRIGEIIALLKEGDIEKINKYKHFCKKCGKTAEFNIKSLVENYVEEGYQPQWDKYMKWLQKTLNRKVLIIELGENFVMPTVMRWPFEKIVYFNNKANLVRVNETFPQVSEEISDKAVSVEMNSIEFIDELNNFIN